MTAFDLTGRVAIVTGGNQGIGLGMAKGLAGAGAAVVIAGRRAEANAQAARQIETEGRRAIAVEVDVQNEVSCRALCARTVERLGRLDILVNNAGTTVRKQPQDYTRAEWQSVIDVNLSGAFSCAQAAY